MSFSLLEHLERRGRFRPEDVARLDLARPFDLVAAKERWLPGGVLPHVSG